MNYKKTFFNLLDCTLRDGGYYNNWNFSKSDIQKYLNNIYTTGIRFVELGFRFYETKKIKGLTAYTSNNLLKKLSIPENLNIGIMINASDLIRNGKFQKDIMKELINRKNISKLKFVRIACHHKEIFVLKKLFMYLKKIQINFFLNIMQISEIRFKDLKKILLFLKKNNINKIYIADSLGCLKSKQLNKIILFLNKNWKGEIGIHAHNNFRQALSNSKIAINKKFQWVDSTITGMGRGPGNTKTEEILNINENYFTTKQFLKTKKFFLKLQKHYKWGPNRYYAYAANKKIHPTYIQKILSDKRYKPGDYHTILKSLAKTNTKKYNPYKLINSVNFISNKANGVWSPKTILKDKDILILGPGKNLINNVNQIEKKVIQDNLFVISLNTFNSIKEKYINLRVICHPFRITSDSSKLNKFNCKFVIPITSFSKSLKSSISLNNKNIYDYGLSIRNLNSVMVRDKYCVLPRPLAIGYALSLAISGNVKSVRLAGFDGYEKSDPDSDNTEELLKIFVKNYFKNKLISLTKTKFNFLSYK